MSSDKWGTEIPDTVTFPEETVENLTWSALKEYREFSQPLCIDGGKIFPGGKPIYGTERGVEPLKEELAVCERGKPIGRIHSHIEEYEKRPPFDKGSSNIDIFSIARETLHDAISFPRLECVVSPTYNKQGYLNGVQIGCERFEKFTEEDIKEMESGIIHQRDDREIREKFDDEDIKFLKYGRPPGGMYARIGFVVRMANLKGGLEKKSFMRYGEFDVPGKREKGRLLCDFKDETLTFEGD